MERPGIADILRAHPPRGLSRNEARVVADLTACRTAALGGHLQHCEYCDYEHPTYNSCRNRHCPKCQGLDQALWVERQARDLVPVPYFHVVFTVPASLHPFFRRDPAFTYGLLLTAAARTLVEVARFRLGATPAIIATLHTWTQLLLQHPHVHCIASGGGLSLDGQRWISSAPRFFLPVRALSLVFRGKLLDALDRALDGNLLHFDRTLGRSLLRQAAARSWVVYSKPPLAGPEQVLRYLGRYTRRVAIGNERIVDMDDDQVRFRYKDRTRKNQSRIARLAASEFLRRFLQHVLPRRFVRVRHFGLLANAFRSRNLTRARALLGTPSPPEAAPNESRLDSLRRLTGVDPTLCPKCHRGALVITALIEPVHPRRSRSP